MQSLNKNRIAYLGALTLLFSYAEMLLPRFVPFLRLGLGNIAILLAFDLNPLSFLILTAIKAVASSLMAGTLFSPFFLISFAQSVLSGFLMYVLAKIFKGRFLGVYGISILGAAFSTLIQIFLSEIYLGKGTKSFLGPMLIFSTFSGFVTAFLSQNLHIPQTTPILNEISRESEESGKQSAKKNLSEGGKKAYFIIKILIIMIAAIFVFTVNNIYILTAALLIAFAFQLIGGRKIMLLPHLWMWLFVIICSLFVPEGKILFSIFNWNITLGALLEGIKKALKLSTVSALSQCAANLRPEGNSLLSLVLKYFSGLCNVFRNSEGNFVNKIKAALMVTEFNVTKEDGKH